MRAGAETRLCASFGACHCMLLNVDDYAACHYAIAYRESRPERMLLSSRYCLNIKPKFTESESEIGNCRKLGVSNPQASRKRRLPSVTPGTLWYFFNWISFVSRICRTCPLRVKKCIFPACFSLKLHSLVCRESLP